MSEEKELLAEVRKLIEGGWTQGTSARDASGLECPVNDPHAAKFCLTGAIRRATGDLERPYSQLYSMLDEASSIGLVSWNDDSFRTKEDVLARIDAAIGRLE